MAWRAVVLGAVVALFCCSSAAAQYIRGQAETFYFLAVSPDDGSTPVTSGTPAVTVAKDGGSPAATTNAAVHTSGGTWKVTLTATEMSAAVLSIRFTLADAVSVQYQVRTVEATPTNDGVPRRVYLTPKNLPIGATVYNVPIHATSGTEPSVTTTWTLDAGHTDSASILSVQSAWSFDAAPYARALRVRMNGAGNDNQAWAYSPALTSVPDLSDCDLHFRFVLNPSDTFTGTGRIGWVDIRPEAGATFEQIRVWNTNQHQTKGPIAVGINNYRLLTGETNAAAALAAMTEMGLLTQFVTAATYSGDITYAELKAVERPDKGQIIIRVDDSRRNNSLGADSYDHLHYAEYANAAGVPLTFAAIKRGTTYDPDFHLGPSDLRQIRDMSVGHVVACHLSYDGSTYNWGGVGGSGEDGWSRMADGATWQTHANHVSAYQEWLEWAQAEGLDRYARILVVPGGYQGKDDQRMLDEGWVDCLHYTREGWPHYPAGSQDSSAPLSTYPVGGALQTCYQEPIALRMGGASLLLDGADDFGDDIQPYIDAAVSGRGRLVVYLHTMPNTLFEELIDYVAALQNAGDIEVRTIADDFDERVGPATADPDTIAAATRDELATELARLDADVSSRLADADYSDAPTAEAVATQVRTELGTELGRIDAAVSTRSTHAAADVWSVGSRTVTAATNITSTGTALPVPTNFGSLAIDGTGKVTADAAVTLGTEDIDAIGDAAAAAVAANLPDNFAEMTIAPTGEVDIGDLSLQWSTDIDASIAAQVRTELAAELSRLDVAVGSRLATGSYTAAPSAAAVASQVRTELGTELARLDASISTRLSGASYVAPLDAAATRAALGLEAADLDDQLANVGVDLSPITDKLPAGGRNMAGAGDTATNLDEIVAEATVDEEAIATAIAEELGEVTSSQPRINKEPSPAFTRKIDRQTHRAVSPIRLTSGDVGNIAFALDMSPLFGNKNFVKTVGVPSISGGSITFGDRGPRDTYAMVILTGTATAGEERTGTMSVEMETGDTVTVEFDVEVLED